MNMIEIKKQTDHFREGFHGFTDEIIKEMIECRESGLTFFETCNALEIPAREWDRLTKFSNVKWRKFTLNDWKIFKAQKDNGAIPFQKPGTQFRLMSALDELYYFMKKHENLPEIEHLERAYQVLKPYLLIGYTHISISPAMEEIIRKMILEGYKSRYIAYFLNCEYSVVRKTVKKFRLNEPENKKNTTKEGKYENLRKKFL